MVKWEEDMILVDESYITCVAVSNIVKWDFLLMLLFVVICDTFVTNAMWYMGVL